MNRMTLTVPADRAWGLVVRTTLGACGVMADLSINVIDDLRSAVDEAFELITHQKLKVMKVMLTCRVEDNMFHISLDAQRAEHALVCDIIDPEVAEMIIGTLVTEVKLEGDQCGIYTVRMSLPVGAK